MRVTSQDLRCGRGSPRSHASTATRPRGAPRLEIAKWEFFAPRLEQEKKVFFASLPIVPLAYA